MASFTEERFNVPVLAGIQYNFEFKTNILEDGNSQEQRLPTSVEDRVRVSLSDLLLTSSELSYVREFFKNRKGKYEGFRYRCEADFNCSEVPEYSSSNTYTQGVAKAIAGTDSLQWQVVKKYAVVDGSSERCGYKTISKLVEDSTIVFIDGVPQAGGFVIDLNNGILIFDTNPSPNGEKVTVSCEFDLAVRFDTDSLSFREIVRNEETYFYLENLTLTELVSSRFRGYNSKDFESAQATLDIGVLPELPQADTFVTIVNQEGAGLEDRESHSSLSKGTPGLGATWLTPSESAALLTWFRSRRGRLSGFYFQGKNVRFDADTLTLDLLANPEEGYHWDFPGIPMILNVGSGAAFYGGQSKSSTYKVSYRLKYSDVPPDSYLSNHPITGASVGTGWFYTKQGNTLGASIRSVSHTAVNPIKGKIQGIVSVANLAGNSSVAYLICGDSNNTPYLRTLGSIVASYDVFAYAEIVKIETLDNSSDSFEVSYTAEGGILTYCHCCKIERSDGLVLGFTSHDCDLTIDGVTYEASKAISPSAASLKVDLSADNLEIKSFINDRGIRDEEILGGKFDNAKISISVVNFVSLPTSLEAGTIIASGRVGEISSSETYFTMELRSRATLLNQGISKKTSPRCPHTFGLNDGNSRCPVNAATYTTNVAVTSSNGSTVSVNNTYATNILAFGTFTFTSGNNEGLTFDIYHNQNNEITFFELPPGNIQVGDNAIVVQGCNKTTDACKSYGAILDFGGFPTGGNWMPGKDKYLSGE